MEDFVRCFICRAACNAATYHWMGPAFPDVFYCGMCTHHMVKFVRGMMARPVGKDDSQARKERKRKKIAGKTAGFYEAAVTSIRPKWPGQPRAVWYIPITAPETLDETPVAKVQEV